MPATVAGIHLGIDTHANRPAANTVPDGSIYSCSTHGLVYKSNFAGNTWATWATLGSTLTYAGTADLANVAATEAEGAATTVPRGDHVHALGIGTTKGDLLVHNGTAWVRRAVGTNGQVLTADSAETDGIKWAAGGGGGAPTTVPYVTTATDGTLSAEVVIPGLAGSPDIRVAGANDDEFDTTDTSDPMTGWTTLGTPTAHDINSTVLSHYYIRQAATASADIIGIYKAIPATPFTVTAKLSDIVNRADYNGAGLFVAVASPGALETLDVLHDSVPNRVGVNNWTNRTTYSSTPVAAITVGGGPIYLRCVVTTTTNIAWYYSHGGLVWRPLITGRNPGFTVGAVGLHCKSQNGTYAGEAAFDWIRFT